MKPNKPMRWILTIAILSIILMVSIAVSLCVGEVSIPFKGLASILSDTSSMEYGVLAYIRIPRTVLAFSIGGSLSISGAILQGIYRNPLVEPYTLGISGGASLGITFIIISGLYLTHILFMPLAGFIGALATILLVYTLSMRKGGLNTNRMLLIGVMISFIASSLIMFLMSVTTAENIHSIVFWTMGSLNESNPLLIRFMLIASLAGLAITYLFAMPLNALRLGEEKAKHLGINTTMVIKILFVLTSLLTGISISVAGIIGFVGLIIPHFVRLIIGNDYRIMLISSFLCGSIFLIVCDIIARTIIAPNELPIGVITGIVGGITFIFMLSRSKIQSKFM